MTNVDLLERTLGHIETNPDTWDQATWVRPADCGTALCFAGHAIAIAHPDAQFLSFTGIVVLHPGTPLEEDVDIPDTAAELLGLDWRESEVLFDPNNNLDRLRSLVADLVAGRPIDFPADDAAAEAVDAR